MAIAAAPGQLSLDAAGRTPTGRPASLQDRYDAWLLSANGRAITDAVTDAAFRLVDRGFRRYGIAALFEAARYEHALRVGPDVDGFKCNNSYRSRLARDLMARYPILEGMFETRELRS